MINKGTNQLALFEDKYLLEVFPVATGRFRSYTPEGTWQVATKVVYPAWQHPDGGPVIPGGVPGNPLGPRWLGLNALGTSGGNYGVHGNNNLYSIGSYASLGCVRMYNEDILWLYDHVPVDTEVKIINTEEDFSISKKFTRVTVNEKELDLAPHLGLAQDGEITYLPLRAVATAIGYRMVWDNSSNALLMSNIEREVSLKPGSSQIAVNTNDQTAGEAPVLIENMTYVPDYYFQRFLQAEISRETESGTIAIKAPVDSAGGKLVKYHLAVKVNGKNVDIPEEITPLSDGENLLVPLHQLCLAVGAGVKWNVAAQSVEVKTWGRRAQIPVDGSPVQVKGIVVKAPSDIFVRNGSSYVNLRFLSDLFGLKTDLDGKERTLNIAAPGKLNLFLGSLSLSMAYNSDNT